MLYQLVRYIYFRMAHFFHIQRTKTKKPRIEFHLSRRGDHGNISTETNLSGTHT